MHIRFVAFFIVFLSPIPLESRRHFLRGNGLSEVQKGIVLEDSAATVRSNGRSLFHSGLVKKGVSKEMLSEETPDQSPASKKKIVIFSCAGGGGHMAVSKGLTEYLEDEYDITVLNALKTVLSPIDTLGTVSFGKLDGEDFYNFCLRCGWTNLLGRYSAVGASYFSWRHSMVVKLFVDYFRTEKPSLIISVMPFINAALAEACKVLDIPLLIITNDLDTTNYIQGCTPPYSKNFQYAIAFDDPEIRRKIEGAKIPETQIMVAGFPIRPQFFAQKNVPKLKKRYAIPEGKPVVMVFMGGAGSQASYRYVRNLARLGMPMHIIACLGRNERLKKNIAKIMLPENVTISLFGFTDKIADLMALSDVLITKPGPNSVCEGLFSGVPMILDLTHGTIWWEQLNIDFMIKHGFAEALTDYTDLARILPKYFKDSSYTDSIKQKMKSFSCKRFNETIKPLVNQMIKNPIRIVDGIK